MINRIQTIRPVGNPILLQKQPLDTRYIANIPIFFYQSGTAALAAALIAIKSLHVNVINTPEVLLPAYTCPDLISACIYAGVTPVIIDLEPNTCWMSLGQIESSITEQTIAIIGVRFLGIAERMDSLRAICERNNLILIEDSAQGFPTTNPDLYWQGDLSILSFGRGKPVNMLGGGAILARKPEIRELLSNPTMSSRKYLSLAKYCLKVPLYNTLIKPAIYGMATKLPRLNVGETVYKPLHEIAGIPAVIYTRLNSNISNYKKLPNVGLEIHNRFKSMGLPDILDLSRLCHHDYHHPLLRFPLLVPENTKHDRLYSALHRFGASLMYQKPLYQIHDIPNGIKSRKNIKYAETFSRQLITLPTHMGVSTEVLNGIFNAITNALD